MSLRKISKNAFFIFLISFGAVTAVSAAGEGSLPYSKNEAVKVQQKDVYDVVNRYETALNKGDTKAIVSLFADRSVAEWNNKKTYATRQEKTDGYDALFKMAKFSTVFAYDAIDIYGDTAVVRTHHHKGAAVIEDGKKVLDFNREVFVLHKAEGKWKIVLYTFNTDPVQGEG